MVEWIKWLPLWIALATFIWYRSGRLWKFYYSLLDLAITQFKVNKLSSKGWQQLADEHTKRIVEDHFGVLFHFEMDYLRWLVNDAKFSLWVSDASSSSRPVVDKQDLLVQETIDHRVVNEEQYCKHTLSSIFYWKFAFGGAGLFLNSLWWFIFRRDRSKGFETKTTKEKIRRSDYAKSGC